MLSVPTSHRVALLIDADNVQLTQLEQILKLSVYYGELKICRAYRDWKKTPLPASLYQRVKSLNIEIRQVDQLGKDTADKQLLIEAGEILGAGAADVFIIASGDGDFRLLVERIKEKGRKVVGIGNKPQTSTHLKNSCDTFYYIEELEEALIQQEFEALLFRALYSIPCDKDGWVHFRPLGRKLRELDPAFKNRFAGKKLSEWLSDLSGQVEVNGQRVRVLKSSKPLLSRVTAPSFPTPIQP